MISQSVSDVSQLVAPFEVHPFFEGHNSNLVWKHIAAEKGITFDNLRISCARACAGGGGRDKSVFAYFFEYTIAMLLVCTSFVRVASRQGR